MNTQRWAEGLTDEERAARLAKPAPNAIADDEKQAARDAVYRKNSKEARRLDGHRCRVCGSSFSLETHHVVPRSLVGKLLRDALENLLTTCHDCHELFTKHVLKVEGSTNARKPLRILKFDKDEGGYVLFREAA